jgi:hypothetical protein
MAVTGIGPQTATPAKHGGLPLLALSQEVSALQTIYALRLTKPQLEELARLGEQTAAKPQQESVATASADFLKTMADLRTALVSGKDDDQIAKLYDRLDTLRESENPDLDDDSEITDAAVENAPQVLDMLSASQVAGYLGTVADDIMDPRTMLIESMEKARSAPLADWTALRDQLAGEISRLVAGLDEDQARRVNDQVVQLLIVARGLKPDEYKSQGKELEQKARRIIGSVGPTEVLRHYMEHALAEFLANPQLSAAVRAKLGK